eukprot:10488679-Alexandrium_andersonii.AAC.1
MSASLVGSEMCIRDRVLVVLDFLEIPGEGELALERPVPVVGDGVASGRCLLYTSDAADDM